MILNVNYDMKAYSDGKTIHTIQSAHKMTIYQLRSSSVTNGTTRHRSQQSSRHVLLLPLQKPHLFPQTQIWKIFCDKAHNDQFGQYRLSVERARNLPGGNSKRRWHGTIRACTVGNNDYQGFACHNSACSLCGILNVRASPSVPPMSPVLIELAVIIPAREGRPAHELRAVRRGDIHERHVLESG